MITVTEKALLSLKINAASPLGAVQDVRAFMCDGAAGMQAGRGAGLVNALLGTSLQVSDIINPVDEDLQLDCELMVAQGVAETVVKNIGQPLDEAEVLANAKARVARLMSAPQHKWMFAKPEPTEVSGEMQTVAAGIELKVAVKADGSIKKGGKELLAVELYKQYTDSLNGAPYENQAFIAILVKQLGMSKAGATTYNYNMKKKFGGQIEPKKAK